MRTRFGGLSRYNVYDMAVSTRIVHTDVSGGGTIAVTPCFFCGSEDAGTITAEVGGAVVGPYAYGDMPFVAGELTFTADPDSDYALFFDFTA